MKTTANSRPRFLPLLALTTAFALAAPGLTRAVEPSTGKSEMHGKMMADCEAMMTEKKAMMTAMKAADVALTAQVSAMNSAPAAQKPELMAGIVTALVQQRITMNTKAGQMSDKMMAHMMEHMEMGKDSMASCPMMNAKGEKSMKSHSEREETTK